MLFAKVIIYFDMAMKYAEKHIENAPAINELFFA